MTLLCLAIVHAGPAFALNTSQGNVTLTKMAEGLDAPWSFGFLPDGSVLITERDGALLRLTEAGLHEVSGVAEVATRGQGGLLDVMVPRDFATSREIFLSYSKKQPDGAGTAVAVARLSDDAQGLESWTEIFDLTPGSSGGRHFGSRIVEAPDGTLFITIGDRGDRPSAQDLSRENGSVIRINRDGSIPVDNPFVDDPAVRPAIWSYGHRNPQGAGLDPDGNLWVSEHGARGGDEVNAVRKGANYGWPVISYGRHYSGAKIGEGTAKDGMEQPAFYWDPSIAPSGLMVYSGALWPEWEGDIFVGSLKFDYIARLDGAPLTEAEQLMSAETVRVRDIREAPDGSIWFLSAGDGALYRLAPG
ncbi:MULTISPECIES: PQQ-dependent sugar dehydrogenase [unclassified Roseovarius]|uniref:PQQ-dependent sugar dehydrogenase n=1 Tax=unclassified Roseovarius TaxID=2614913 RepID=UPI002740068F|nr:MULTISPECIES: PQQ-dependent sugar dehydrogenase [unclassified Roseovarius]